MADAPRKKKKMTRAEHDAHVDHAAHHVGAALGYLIAAGHVPSDPDNDGDTDAPAGADSDDGGGGAAAGAAGANSYSAQGRISFRANTGAARAFRAATGRR